MESVEHAREKKSFPHEAPWWIKLNEIWFMSDVILKLQIVKYCSRFKSANANSRHTGKGSKPVAQRGRQQHETIKSLMNSSIFAWLWEFYAIRSCRQMSTGVRGDKRFIKCNLKALTCTSALAKLSQELPKSDFQCHRASPFTQIAFEQYFACALNEKSFNLNFLSSQSAKCLFISHHKSTNEDIKADFYCLSSPFPYLSCLVFEVWTPSVNTEEDNKFGVFTRLRWYSTVWASEYQI